MALKDRIHERWILVRLFPKMIQFRFKWHPIHERYYFESHGQKLPKWLQYRIILYQVLGLRARPY